jgi:hypothetical protein
VLAVVSNVPYTLTFCTAAPELINWKDILSTILTDAVGIKVKYVPSAVVVPEVVENRSE